jgi:hypothetical protein
MKLLKFVFSVLLILLQFDSGLSLNDRPMVGVLTQEYKGSKGKTMAFIATPYVRFLEMAGARVVCIVLELLYKSEISLWFMSQSRV